MVSPRQLPFYLIFYLSYRIPTIKMVHLARVSRDPSQLSAGEVAKQLDAIQLDDVPADDDYGATVYGTRFARQQLPHDEMPDGEMPREVAYRMIKDELSLDGNPMLKYAFIHRSLLRADYYCPAWRASSPPTWYFPYPVV